MDSLIYSLNATVPVFLVMALGYLLRRRGLLNENFVAVSNRFNYTVTLPALLYCDMAAAHVREEFQPKLVLFCAGVTTLMFLGVWLLAKLTLRDKAQVGAFVQASYRCSVAVLGVAFITNIYGDPGVAPQMILGAVPLFNIYAVVVLTFENGRGDGAGKNLAKAAKGVVANPLLSGLGLGLFTSLLGITLPAVAEKTLESVGALATPQALICIGAGFEGKKALSKLKPTLGAAFIKLIALPALFLPLAAAVGFRDQALMVILVMLGAPTTPSSYVLAKSLGGDEVLTSSAVVATTLLSAFTLTFWIFLYRQLGYLG